MFGQPMSIFTACSSGAGIAFRQDAFGMGIMACNTGHFTVFIQRKPCVEHGFHLLDFFQSFGRRYDPHMIDVSRVISRDMVESTANGFNVSDEGDILECCVGFIGFFFMTNETSSNENLIVVIDL